MLLCPGCSAWALSKRLSHLLSSGKVTQALCNGLICIRQLPVSGTGADPPLEYFPYIFVTCVSSLLSDGRFQVPVKLTNMQTTSRQPFNTSPLQAAPSNVLLHLKETLFPQVLVETP